ncbi:preprotein translocase YidC [Ammoniphilus oxalaticus]|uniref:Membrane protein insertase YidC n=1 Tax=Ammoniphilus oxalaticus TaxID=66863 RepID=A0A419SHF2_9BACL|nr:membrane protein insertase YidC [Ammoniphilus oxalaticus]RKD23220.1 preprotein translocase YidC [Ammoniphilus oxalaticus]
MVLSGCNNNFVQNPTPIDPQGGFWDRYFVFPLSWLLDTAAEYLGGSYGLSILFTTIIIRLAVLPLMVKQLRSSRAMQIIQPELQKIKEKYKDNQQKAQEETMKLFQKHNVNPLAGCLPLFVQMPILIAFYQAIMRNESVRTHDFLWMSLGNPDPLYVLPIAAAITTFLQSKLMGTGMPQNPQMQMMLYIMPAMILFIAITLPSALSLYWVFGNIFTIIQTFFIKGNTPVPTQEVKK